MEKKQLKIPGFIFGIIGILIACIIFLIFVQVPFSKKYSTYETSHASAAAEIQKYNDYLSRADQVQASIDSMKKKYEENIGKLTVNSTKSAQDIRDMLKKLDYDLSTLSVAKGVVDAEGRTSSTGDPLYSTSINFTFTASYQKMLDTLNYFETESDGAYYISTMSIAQNGGGDSSETSIAADKSDYVVALTMNLYYFNITEDDSSSTNVSASSTESSAS